MSERNKSTRIVDGCIAITIKLEAPLVSYLSSSPAPPLRRRYTLRSIPYNNTTYQQQCAPLGRAHSSLPSTTCMSASIRRYFICSCSDMFPPGSPIVQPPYSVDGDEEAEGDAPFTPRPLARACTRILDTLLVSRSQTPASLWFVVVRHWW